MLKSITSGVRRVFKSDAQDDDENQGRFSEILKWAEENNIGEDRIPREPSELIGLNRLDLSFRRLQSLPETLGELALLTELDLRGNELKRLPDSIGDLALLRRLDLKWNQLETLPDSPALPDPYLGQAEDFERTFTLLEQALRLRFAHES